MPLLSFSRARPAQDWGDHPTQPCSRKGINAPHVGSVGTLIHRPSKVHKSGPALQAGSSGVIILNSAEFGAGVAREHYHG